MYLASLRLAVALVCLGASLILGAQWVGFLPDPTPSLMRGRKMLCESIAVNSAAHIRRRQWTDLEAALQLQVDRNPEILSVGIRSDLGILRVSSAHHADIWDTRNDEVSHVAASQVPITLNQRPWGEVEICFHQPHQTMFEWAMQHPLLRLLMFFCATGLFAYTFFVVRILKLFNSTQVVPDRVRQALDTLAEGLLVLDEKGCIVLANRAFTETVGIPAEDLAQRPASELSWTRDQPEDGDYAWQAAISELKVQSEQMLRYQLADGTQRIFSVNAAPLGRGGSQRGALATFRDVTHVEEHRAELEKMLSLLRSSRDEIKRKNVELEILATQDALTGCLNRRAFFEHFDRLWIDADQTGLACVMIDIDHFKSVNDTYGHYTGDEVLRQVSRVVRELHKEHGVICRYGGEEFCLILPGYSLDRAIDEAERTRMAIGEIRLSEPADLRLSASLGVSEMRFDPQDPQDLINQADACLYVAKREGRNRVVAYDPEMAEADQDNPVTSKTRRIEIPYQAVTALVSALSYRDVNTAEHSRRVADLCARVSDGLFDPEQTYVLEIAALLHDIGKIGVPDHILLKPGPLTRDEWEVMGRHDRIGVEIIASAFDCPELSEIISTHHAFYGGAARDPHLPSGEDIPLGARLLSIADSYDAMVSDRVYRKGRSHEEALQELRRCSGTQFDPRLVEHFATKIEQRIPEQARGAVAVRKQTTIQIGFQVERLAQAIDAQDAAGLESLAGRLGMIARACDIGEIAEAASRIQNQAQAEEIQWLGLLRETHELLDICRATQSNYLRQTLASEAQHARDSSR